MSITSGTLVCMRYACQDFGITGCVMMVPIDRCKQVQLLTSAVAVDPLRIREEEHGIAVRT